jgi:four helix bundle protein
MYGFEKLTVWQKAMDFCELIYKESRKFPKEELFGIISQIRRSSTSILLNISEGSACKSKREFSHFLNIALCSQYETIAILKLCNRLEYLNKDIYENLLNKAEELGKLLHGLIGSLKTNN